MGTSEKFDLKKRATLHGLIFNGAGRPSSRFSEVPPCRSFGIVKVSHPSYSPRIDKRMFEKLKSKLNATQCHALLEATAISAEAPGSILRDVSVMLEFIGTEDIETKSKNGNLPTAVLVDLNERLSDPVDLALKRPLLRHYPNLAGVYLLLRTLGIVVPRGKRIELDATILERWRALSSAEQYFTLLEAWFFYADPEMLDAGNEQRFAIWLESLYFLGEIPKSKRKTYPDYVHTYSHAGFISDWGAQLHIRFGLIVARPAIADSVGGTGARGWRLLHAKRTEWGTAVVCALLEWLDRHPEEPLRTYCQPPFNYGDLKSAFGQYFPEWTRCWTEPEHVTQPGTYRFAVTLAHTNPPFSPRRVFRVPGHCSFCDLGEAVLKSVKFDNDHAYAFRYRDSRGITRVYMNPWLDEGPFADEITFETAELPNKGIIRFVYDFGDKWEFQLKLVSVDPEDPALDKPQLVESEGMAPEQYPSWE